MKATFLHDKLDLFFIIVIVKRLFNEKIIFWHKF